MAAILQKSETREKRRLAMPTSEINLGNVVKVSLDGPTSVQLGSVTHANPRAI